MASFSEDNNSQPRILFLDCTITSPLGQDANCVLWTRAMAQRLGCYVEQWHYESGVPDKVYSESAGWDLIVVPSLTGHVNAFSNFTTALAKFEDSTIPVFVVGVYAVTTYLSTATAATGLTTVPAASSAADRVSTDGIKNWNGGLAGRVTYYCQDYTGWDSTVTEHIESTANELLMWSKTVSGHPCLFNATYVSGHTNSASTPKCYPGFQWMCDQQSTATKNVSVKAKINKMHLLMRWDELNDNSSRTAWDAGETQACYSAALPYFDNIQLAAVWTGDLSTDRTDVTAWHSARDKEANGGLFMCHNHYSDMYDGANACSSNHIAFDNFEAAGQEYEGHCDDLTTAGFTVGSDGYGKGYSNVQNGNDMDNPTAMFLGGDDDPYRVWSSSDTTWYGGYQVGGIFLTSTENYPTLPSAVQGKAQHTFSWNGAQVLLCDNGDNWDISTSLEISGSWNTAIHRNMIIGGAIYYHATAFGATELQGYITEFGQLFTCYSDIITNEWDGMVESQQRGLGMLYTD